MSIDLLQSQRDIALAALAEGNGDTLADLLEAHSSMAINTRRQYRRMIKKILEELPKPLLRMSQADALEYREQLEGQYMPTTVHNRFSLIRRIYQLLEQLGADVDDVFVSVRPRRDTRNPRELGKVFRASEFERLLEHAQTPAERVLLLLGGHSGLRASEIAGARWLDRWQDDHGEWLRVFGKGGHVESVPLSKSTLEALSELVTLPREQDQYILPWRTRHAIYFKLRAMCEQAGVEFKGVHALRHHCAERVAENTNGNIMLLARLLRHKNLQTADRYVGKRERELARLLARW